MKTSFPKPAQPQWYVVDARNQVLGRLCAKIAIVLRGRHRPSFVPHWRCGDHVIVLNADKVTVTGAKAEQKAYFRHAGYLGNLRETPMKRLLKDQPGKVIELAVKGMLPKNPTRQHTLKQLHVFTGSAHEHEAQKPLPFPLSIV
ncbi:MAG: 50S ribosomal protein L13 [Candidatus Peribacteraceae bacterium]